MGVTFVTPDQAPFREKVKREQWVENLPKSRGALGAAKSRTVEVSSFKPSLPGIEPLQDSFLAWLMKVRLLKPAYLSVLKGHA